MRTPVSDAELREVWSDLCMVGDLESVLPAIRIALENTARIWRDRKPAPKPPPVDLKRRAANDYD
ncbi:hypothetical protein C5615_08770 [Burkholderia cepacia]|uniref:Uncharacterized protein n=1 Tax=Burkholderia cepacia TaxID=292 RepID=A0A2S8IZ51_BURCE|nr:hypothetical protein [Burkholderia cepacia]PQP19959.1 hypothetical protein C5615_08770 [Burkholderia cepacia]HDR9506587.1 hypothetical protein [Burkholderia cepacia]